MIAIALQWPASSSDVARHTTDSAAPRPEMTMSTIGTTKEYHQAQQLEQHHQHQHQHQ
jgi:hypothetical protein